MLNDDRCDLGCGIVHSMKCEAPTPTGKCNRAFHHPGDCKAYSWEDLARDVINDEDKVRDILRNAIDRDRDSSTPIQLAYIASNAIYWRNVEIERFKQWLLMETGTTDLNTASTELRRWRQLSGLFQAHRCRQMPD
jgi:hypothetical protein